MDQKANSTGQSRRQVTRAHRATVLLTISPRNLRILVEKQKLVELEAKLMAHSPRKN